MAKLFYKDLKAHEKAYRNQRADEAGNDLILGAKVNAYNGFTEASNKSVNEIATNYANFLKELQVKDLDLKNKSTMEEKTLEKNAKEGKFLYMTPQEVKENVLMGLEDKPRRLLIKPKKTLLLTQRGSKKNTGEAKAKPGRKTNIERENILMGSQDRDIRGPLFPKQETASQQLMREAEVEKTLNDIISQIPKPKSKSKKKK